MDDTTPARSAALAAAGIATVVAVLTGIGAVTTPPPFDWIGVTTPPGPTVGPGESPLTPRRAPEGPRARRA